MITFIRNWYVVDHNLWFKNHENNGYSGIIGPSKTIKGRIQMGHPEVNEQSGDDSSGSSPSVSTFKGQKQGPGMILVNLNVKVFSHNKRK